MAKTNWKVKFLIFSIIITLPGFIQWESWFNIEIRNNALQNLAGGELAFGGLFLFFCAGVLLLLKHTKAFMQRFLFLIFSFVVLLGISWWMLNIFANRYQWRDKSVYKNGDDYIVVELTTQEYLGLDPF